MMAHHQSHGFLAAFDDTFETPAVDRVVRKQQQPSRRHSSDLVHVPGSSDPAKNKEHTRMKERTVSRSSSSRGVERSSTRIAVSSDSKQSRTSSRNSSTARHSKSNRSMVAPALSDASDDSRGGPNATAEDQKDQPGVLEVRNRALIHENRRLQELVSEYERRFGLKEDDLNGAGMHAETANDITHSPVADDDDGDGEESVTKLKAKIRSLKTKRKHEKLQFIQMEKTVKAHVSEVESLRRELDRTVTELEKAERGRQDDKHKISTLNKQLADVDQLKADLQKRDNELEVTLELLQSKTEYIIQLEHDVEEIGRAHV